MYTNANAFQKLLDFLSELEQRKIYFKLDRIRPEAIMIEIAVPGARWEVEFFADAHIEVEVFASASEMEGEEALVRLFEQYSD